MRTAIIRPEVLRLMNQRPFRPFALLMGNGDRVIVEHPENVAFDPTAPGPGRFAVITSRLVVHSTFEAVTSVTELDTGVTAE